MHYVGRKLQVLSIIKYLLGEFVAKLLPFFLLPYFTRSLGVDGYGELALFQSLFMITVMVTSFVSDASYVRYYFYYGRRGSSYLLLASSINSIFIFLLSICLVFGFSGFFDLGEIYVYALIVGLLQSFFNLCLAIFQASERSTYFVTFQIGLSVLSTLLTVFLFEVYDASVFNRVLSLILSISFFLLLYMILIRRDTFGRKFSCLKPSLSRLKLYFSFLYSYAFPLFINQVAYFIRGQFDRLFIHAFFSASMLGIYSAYNQLSLIIPVAIGAIARAITPPLYARIKREPKFILLVEQAIAPVFCAIVTFGLGIYYIPNEFFELILGPEFAIHSYLFSIFCFSGLLQIIYVMLSTFVIYFGKSKQLAFCTAITSALHMLFVAFLSSLGGYMIAFSSILSAVISIALVYYFAFVPLRKEILIK